MADILNRIRKLIELSKHNNSPEEAAQAAALAQDMMFRHQIGETDLEIDTSDREPEQLVEETAHRESGKRRQVWKACLAHAVARGFGCEMYNARAGDQITFQIFGLKSAVQTVNYVFGYLVLEIERMCQEEWVEHGTLTTHGKTWKNSFRMGAVNAIRERLEQQRAAQQVTVKQKMAEGTSTALALYKTNEERVEEGWEDLRKKRHLRGGGKVSYRNSASAYERGQAAGNSISLGGGRSLGAAKSRLGY